jgi:hypothetical protein
MMVHLVGGFRDAADERDSIGESLEGECLRENVAAPCPPWQSAERALNFDVGKLLSHTRFYHALPSQAISRFLRRIRRSSGWSAALLVVAASLRAQSADSIALSPNYWRRFGYGFTTSILLHEAAHIVTAFAVGGHPTFGFDKLRPTVYSGVNTLADPHKQFLFSAAGLTAQSVLDEAILDVPHVRGSAFERGLLGGGIGTTLFYLTIGRRGSVSDVDFMARTHALTTTQVTLIFGSVAALHSVRISRNPRYANFFARPRDTGLDLGLSFEP